MPPVDQTPLQAPGRLPGQSLYARAALFLALGVGSLVGAFLVLTRTMVDDAVNQLLEERIELARTAGSLLEHVIASDLSGLAAGSAPFLDAGPEALERVRSQLVHEYKGTVFGEGVFLLDSKGQVLLGVPDIPAEVVEAIDLPALAALARSSGRPVTTPLVEAGAGGRPVLVLLTPIAGAGGGVKGYVGGLLQPASANVLSVLTRGGRNPGARLELIDAGGLVVASTDRAGLYRLADHDSLLAGALRSGSDVRGRCHGCHERGSGDPGDVEVLAFAPLPTLQLGLAVHQPESQALAPAFEVRSRLIKVGIAFVALFLLFSGLSVHSVVSPVKRLTAAVGDSQARGVRTALPVQGRDEVGTLARALDSWRERMFQSLAEAERTRAALHAEVEANRRQLAALHDIAEQDIRGQDMASIVERGLDHIVDLLGVEHGVLWVRHAAATTRASRNLDEDVVECLAMRSEEAHQGLAGDGPGRPYEVRFVEIPPGDRRSCVPMLGTVLSAAVTTPPGLQLLCTVGHPSPGANIERRHLQSLLHHVGLSATNRLLRRREQSREALRQQYLHRVLVAQEDERRRVARELHDTLAQDLAALRLEVELVAGHAEGPQKTRLEELEERTRRMLVSLRSVLLDLRVPVLEGLGFLATVQWHLDRIEREHGLRTTLSVDGDEVDLPPEVSVPLFRILQEATQNTLQHSTAGHIFVSIEYEPEQVRLLVEDDGEGFSLETREVGSDGRGLGLLGMDERARLLGGELSVTSSPGDGTVVSARVPTRRGGVA